MTWEYKSEAQLQYECVKWFNNTHKDYRGCLVEINNNTNKGAYRKSLGQVKGASDLVFFNPYHGTVLMVELKLNGSTHSVKHLNDQLKWLNLMDSGFQSLFCFSLEMFQYAVLYVIENDFISIEDMCCKSRNFIESKIINAEFRKVKSVKLDYGK